MTQSLPRLNQKTRLDDEEKGKVQLLTSLQLQLKNEAIKQKQIFEVVENLIMSNINRRGPCILIAPTLRRYKPFAIRLSTPKNWFNRFNYNDQQIKNLAKLFKVVKAQTLIEAKGCRCRKEGSLISVRLEHIEGNDEQEFFVRYYTNYDEYIWTDCRVHCATTKSHYASDLVLSLELPNTPPIYSSSFCSIRMSKEKATTIDKTDENVSALLYPFAKSEKIEVNGKEVLPCVCSIYNSSWSPLQLSYLIHNNEKHGRMKLKIQRAGKFYCSFFTFLTVADAQMFISENMNYAINRALVTVKSVCLTSSKVLGHVFNTFLSFFSNFISPIFNWKEETIVTSRQNESNSDSLMQASTSLLQEPYQSVKKKNEDKKAKPNGFPNVGQKSSVVSLVGESSASSENSLEYITHTLNQLNQQPQEVNHHSFLIDYSSLSYDGLLTPSPQQRPIIALDPDKLVLATLERVPNQPNLFSLVSVGPFVPFSIPQQPIIQTHPLMIQRNNFVPSKRPADSPLGTPSKRIANK